MNEFIGMINLWQLTRLPKAFDFKYSATKEENRKYFNSLKDAIYFASAN